MDSNLKTCSIVCSSEFNNSDYEYMKNHDMFDYQIAVDGGYKHFLDLGIVPNIVIGDFDSYAEPIFGIRTLKFPPEKDASDFELACEKAKSLGYKKFYIFGALGNRIDHTLCNLKVAKRFVQKGIDVEICGTQERIIFLNGEDLFECKDLSAYGLGDNSSTVSIIPCSEHVSGVYIRGLKYEASNSDMDEYSSLGLSNESKGEPFLIGIEQGTLAIIINY